MEKRKRDITKQTAEDIQKGCNAADNNNYLTEHSTTQTDQI
jgi:hypothetical protein